MSDWLQILNISTLTRDATAPTTTVAPTVTPITSKINRNYYNPLPDFESDTDLDLNESDPDSVITPHFFPEYLLVYPEVLVFNN